MFKEEALAVLGLMASGKLLILVSGSLFLNTGHANEIFHYQAPKFENHLPEERFGWFRKLNPQQLASYNQALFHAVLAAENGEVVTWYKQDASGRVIPVITRPTGSGYCRQLYLETIAHNRRVTRSATACYSTATRNWRWTQWE